MFPRNPLRGTLNGSIWSVRYEAYCYIGVLIMAALGFLRNRRWSLLALLAACCLRLLFEVADAHPGAGLVGTVLGAPEL